MTIVVLGQDDWGVTYSSQSICVLKGSTVELCCTYNYPNGHNVTETYWFTTEKPQNTYGNLQTDPNYSGRVAYRNYNSNHDNNNHTLTITDLRMTDSAEYKFTFITDQPRGQWIGQPGVTLHVTAQTTDTDNQDDLHYASVHSSSSKKQEVPLYSNTLMPQELILVPK
ncbi:hypothetical protein DPEC_G00170880 [Dallia pectoralis]|uniref:Uncharacterized protein n=1 Tax=Dallia pectoralis TaxID=75939 RepID=A0ACC2GCZ0_DALPE|nr:hypothetical protein DPEC_G00170880 [Dallia pectoralis]